MLRPDQLLAGDDADGQATDAVLREISRDGRIDGCNRGVEAGLRRRLR
jgi:hypothetical protein